MAKGVRSILFLLHTSSHLLTPYSDSILDALIVAKRLILEQSNRDIRFLATINLKSVMNKSIRYSSHSRFLSLAEDVRNNERDLNYFTILSSFLLLSSLPTVYIDSYYAFAVSPTGVLHVYSMTTACLVCSTTIHSGTTNKIKVFTRTMKESFSTINRNQDYFILFLSRSERTMFFYLFNDRHIPYKSLLRQLRSKHFTFRDYSSVSLVKIAILFIPCNSSIQPETCSMCRRMRHRGHMSDFFIFQGRNNPSMEVSNLPSHIDNSELSIIPGNNLDDIDFASLPLGTLLYEKPRKKSIEEEQPLLHQLDEKCWVCRNPIEQTRPRRHSTQCCCMRIEHLVITPQSLMPTSFSQDYMMAQHLPPSQLYICEECETLILCGNQSLSSSKLNGLASEPDPWNLNLGTSQNRLSSFRTGNVSLSAMLAHVGHAVNDFSLDQDFQLRIEPWGNSPEKRPEAFRVFLQLTDLVIVWYDVLVKDIYVWIVCD